MMLGWRKKKTEEAVVAARLKVWASAVVLYLTPLLSDAGDIVNSVRFHDIAANDGAGIRYRRAESARDRIWDALKAQPVLSAFQLGMVPLKSRGAPGVAIFDYDGDGDLDLYVTNGPGVANSLYANQWSESGELGFVDRSFDAGVAATDMDASGVCYGDIDNDGDQDLYVLGSGEPNRLFENRGNGMFADITASSGMGSGRHYSASCSMGDVNGDGLLDIVIANTSDTWDNRLAIFNAFGFNDHNQLFTNTGNRTFVDSSDASGIRKLAGFPDQAPADAASVTWAIALVDYDLDGDADIVWVDDQGGGVLPANQGGVDRGFIHIMNNDGTGKFRDVTVQAGTNRFGDWKGLSFGDINADGYMDLFVTNVGDYVLTVFPRPLPYELGSYASRWFLGQPDGSFRDPGLGELVSSVFGWGTVMEDYDNDGDTDIIYYGGGDGGPLIEVSNPGMYLNNDGAGGFRYDPGALDGSINHSRRNVQGLAGGDLNRDGFVDIVSVSNLALPPPMPLVPYATHWGSDADATAFFFPSFTPVSETEFSWNGMDPADGGLSVEINSADNGNHWASVSLLGTAGLTTHGVVNRDGIGAVVRFTPEGGITVMRPVLGGASYASQDSLAVNLGMGKARKGVVDVLWPGGVRNRFYGLRASERLVLPEIPCSYTTAWDSAHDYRHCVTRALRELSRAGKLPRGLKKRLMKSAMRAYREAGPHGRRDDDSSDAGESRRRHQRHGA
ncbi:MAG TPA: CRTAC1 family protein [Gammaproteobacteria bacterium]|nr:CRTAC1 family protein [Gammaproteobacteria bacterium]